MPQEGVGRARIARAGRALCGLQRVCRAPADRCDPRLPHGLGHLGAPLDAGLGAERDHVGQLADRLDVAQRGEPLEAQRVEPIARQQREVGLDRAPNSRAAP